MNKVTTIIRKEWAEVFKNRLVLFTVAFLPLLFIIIALATIVGVESTAIPEGESTGAMEALPGAEAFCQGLSEQECTVIYMVNLFTLMFMILPVTIPVTIAAYSIVGEKAARSLEPLLATPITTTELLLGKALAAVIPAIAATWISYIIYAIGAGILGGAFIVEFLLQPLWLLAIFVVGPLMALLAVIVATMISSRVSDPRVAEQLAGVVILPVILFLVGQSVGLILIDQTAVMILGAIVLVLDLILGYLALQIFQREKILTSWK